MDSTRITWATMTAVIITAAIYGLSSMDHQRAEDLLFLSNASIYSDPWRVVTSTLMHRVLPHFGFNLFTLWWFGAKVERPYGAEIFIAIFLGALWTGQMAELAVGMLPLYGVSGAVCGLYGFLLIADWKGGVLRTLRQRAEYWLYPLALIALFIADRLGLIPVANFNHVA